MLASSTFNPTGAAVARHWARGTMHAVDTCSVCADSSSFAFVPAVEAQQRAASPVVDREVWQVARRAERRVCRLPACRTCVTTTTHPLRVHSPGHERSCGTQAKWFSAHKRQSCVPTKSARSSGASWRITSDDTAGGRSKSREIL